MIGSISICVMTTTGMGQHLLLLSSKEFEGYLRVWPFPQPLLSQARFPYAALAES